VRLAADGEGPGRDNETTHRYDALGQLTKKTKPDGTSLWYQYDGAGRLTRITEL
jgi:YD repeat-containing protein